MKEELGKINIDGFKSKGNKLAEKRAAYIQKMQNGVVDEETTDPKPGVQKSYQMVNYLDKDPILETYYNSQVQS